MEQTLNNKEKQRFSWTREKTKNDAQETKSSVGLP